MKKLQVMLVLVCFIVLSLVAHVSIAVSQEKTVTLRFSESSFPATHSMAMLMADWSKEVAKRTDGRVKVDFFPGGILAPSAQVYDSVKKGIADMGDTFASYTKGRFPLTETIDLPYGYKSSKMGTALANEFFKKFKPKEFDDAKIMFFYTAGPQILCTKKPVNTLEEVKGMKIRSTGTSAKIVEHLGAAPVGMPMGDAYDALSRGVVTGAVGPTEVLKGWKLAEVLSSCTNYGSSHVNAAFIFMNKNKWNTISAKDQQIIEKLNTEWIDKVTKMWDDADKDGVTTLAQKGGKVIQLSQQEQDKWRNLLRPILDEYKKELNAQGLPGDDAVKFCQDYVRTH
ncbi:MAG TPA: TRAP transporter substrate-binding protein [Syntrophorhabdaceae bacterium]|nr:TRAP transporter substrate-binding protein [Syntrophorhabdaceae bacterium]